MSGGPSSVIPVQTLPQNSSSPGDPFLRRFPEYKTGGTRHDTPFEIAVETEPARAGGLHCRCGATGSKGGRSIPANPHESECSRAKWSSPCDEIVQPELGRLPRF